MKITLFTTVLMMTMGVNYGHTPNKNSKQEENRKAKDFLDHYNKITKTEAGKKEEKDKIDSHLKECKEEGHDHPEHLKPENFSAKFSEMHLYQKSQSVIATMAEHKMPIQEKFTENFKQSISLIPGKSLFTITNDKDMVYSDTKENINLTFTLVEKDDLKDLWTNNTLLENLEHYFHEKQSIIETFHEKIIAISNPKARVDFEKRAPVSLLYSFARETNIPQRPIEFYGYLIVNVPVLKDNQAQEQRETFIFKSNDSNTNPINLDKLKTFNDEIRNKFHTSVENQLKDHRIQYKRLPIAGFYTVIAAIFGLGGYKLSQKISQNISPKNPVLLKEKQFSDNHGSK